MRYFVNVANVLLCAFSASILGTPASLNAATQPKASTSIDLSANAELAQVDATEVGAAQSRVAQSYGDLPLSFEENRGQSDQRVRFLSRGAGYTFFLTPGEAVLALSQDQVLSQAAVLHLKLAGANGDARISGADALPGSSNYFPGQDPRKWHTGVPTFRKVAYENIYPGINLVYYGNQRQLEYDFVVAPGADPRLIRLAIEGAGKLSLDAQGNLVLATTAGEVRLLAPRIYQDIDGGRRSIAGQWTLHGKNAAGFRLAAYDHSRTLVIDPVLVYSSFLGGSQKNSLSRIAIDSAGNAYVAGFTASGDFPTAPTPQAMTFGGGSAQRGVFVAKIDPTGSTLLYSTYLSGSASEQATGLALDASGNAYVTGNTTSADFPVRNAFQSSCAVNPSTGKCSNAFLTKISAAGDTLLYSTYLGGTGTDSASSLAVDSKGNAYLVGVTSSLDFPATTGAAQTKCSGTCTQNAFVAKFNATGESLSFATFLGGSGSDSASDVALDSAGNVYVTGRTTSADFPLASAFQKTCTVDLSSQAAACVATAFVTKIKADGSALAYSTYLGGSLGSQGSGIAVDALGSAYVTGNTQSADFPVLNAFQKTCGIDAASGQCSVDAFLSKFTPSGKGLVYSTYLGGSGRDEASAIALDAAGNAHIIGRTESADFPTAKALQSKLNGISDAFVTKFNAAGSALLFSTFHGGSATESGNGIALDAKGNVYLAGETSSPDFPTSRPFQSSCAGGCNNAFVSKMTLPPANSAPTITSNPGTTLTVGTLGSFTVTTTGTPTPSLNDGGFTLPAGIGFVDNGDGTGTLSGTAGSGTGGTYNFTLTASNGVPPDATQNFTLTLNEPASITSLNKATFTEGAAGTFTVTALGFPKPTLSDGGATLPSGVTFTPGTGKLAGTPAAGTAGSYPITFTAHNGIGADGTQAFTLTVTPAPVLSAVKAHSGSFTQGGTGTWTVVVSNTQAGSTTTSGLTVADTLPAGYTLAAGSGGTNWSCSGANAVTCTSTSTVAGGSAYPTLTLNVNVPNNSPTSVNNTATASGGGALSSATSNTDTVTVTQVPANLTATGGTPQSVPVGNNFAAFSATVTDAATKPMPGVTVTFTVIPAAGGASCSFAGSSSTPATSDASGVATTAVPCTANNISGAYSVQASVSTSGVPKPKFSVTNTDFSLAFSPTFAHVAPGTAPSGVTITATALSGYAPTSLTVASCVGAGTAPVPTCNITSPITVGTAAAVTISDTGSTAGIYTITATVHDSSAVQVTHTATFTLNIVQVTISTPPPTTLEVNQTMGFSGSTAGLPDNTVNWAILGTNCSGAACGTVSPAGPNTSTTYNSPGSAVNGSGAGISVAIKATSNGDAGFSAQTAAFPITDFSLGLPSGVVVLTQGVNGSSTLTATGINGYAGTLNSSASATFCAVSPSPASAPTCSFPVPSIPPSSSTTATVTVNTQTNTPVGLYSFSATATDTAGVPQQRTTASESLAVQCTYSLAVVTPTFTPAVNGTVAGAATPGTNAYSIGVTETAGGSACPFGNVSSMPVVGIATQPSDTAGDGAVVLNPITAGLNGILTGANSNSAITFEVASATTSAQFTAGTSGVTVSYFQAPASGSGSFVTSSLLPVGVEATVPESAVAGGTVSPFPLAVSNFNQAGFLQFVNVAGTSSVCGVVDKNGLSDPNSFGITCSAPASTQLPASGTVPLSVTISATTPTTAALRPSHDQKYLAALYAFGFGLPGIIFMGMGASAFGPKRGKTAFKRMTSVLGILLLVLLLGLLPSCGGGIKGNPFGLPGNGQAAYTLTVMGTVTDGSGAVVGVDVFTVSLTVKAQ